MTTVTMNQKMLDLIQQMNTRLGRIEVDMKDIKSEIGLEVRPEYLARLNKIQNQKGKSFGSKKDFLNYLNHEI